MLTLPSLPAVAGLCVLAGIAIGGGGAWYVRGAEVGRLENQIFRLENANILAKSLAQSAANRAEGIIAGLQSDLARAYQQSEKVYVETIKTIEVAASPARQCLSPRVVGVLNRNDPAPGKGQDPRVALGIAPAAATDTSGPGASEQAVALWITAAMKQYVDLRDRHRTLAATVRALPCIEVVE